MIKSNLRLFHLDLYYTMLTAIMILVVHYGLRLEHLPLSLLLSLLSLLCDLSCFEYCLMHVVYSTLSYCKVMHSSH
jgi:hypothetical protein